MTDLNPNSDAKTMIAQINEAVSEDRLNLSEWESDFIESISSQVNRGRQLSEKQDEVLLRIWGKLN
jgi:hypothetical protein